MKDLKTRRALWPYYLANIQHINIYNRAVDSKDIPMLKAFFLSENQDEDLFTIKREEKNAEDIFYWLKNLSPLLLVWLYNSDDIDELKKFRDLVLKDKYEATIEAFSKNFYIWGFLHHNMCYAGESIFLGREPLLSKLVEPYRDKEYMAPNDVIDYRGYILKFIESFGSLFAFNLIVRKKISKLHIAQYQLYDFKQSVKALNVIPDLSFDDLEFGIKHLSAAFAYARNNPEQVSDLATPLIKEIERFHATEELHPMYLEVWKSFAGQEISELSQKRIKVHQKKGSSCDICKKIKEREKKAAAKEKEKAKKLATKAKAKAKAKA